VTNGTIDLSIEQFLQRGTTYIPADTEANALVIAKNKLSPVNFKFIVSNAGTFGANNVKIKGVFTGSGYALSNIRNVVGATYDGTAFTLFEVPSVNSNGNKTVTFTADILAAGGVATNTLTIQDAKGPEGFCYNPTITGIGSYDTVFLSAGTPPPPGPTPTDKPLSTRLWKTANRTFAKVGDEIEYTMSFKNTGAGDLHDVVLIDTFPAEYLEPVKTPGGTLTNNRVVEYTRKFLPAGDTFTVKATMRVRAAVPKGTKMTNVLTARTKELDIPDKDDATVTVVDDTTLPPPPPPPCQPPKNIPQGQKWVQKNCQLVSSGFSLGGPLSSLFVSFAGIAIVIRRKSILKSVMG
ncbi:MAG: hypothetical protein WCJ84_01535, partial [Candidatus Peregrinibacteria bacterium]